LPKPRDYVLSFLGVIDLLSILPPYLSYFLPNARYMILLRSFRFIRIFRIFKPFSFIDEVKDKPKDGRCPRCGDIVRDKDHSLWIDLNDLPVSNSRIYFRRSA
jgi:hypothetical protein